VAALAPHLATYPLPKRALLDILDGVEMDLDRNRYATWEDLRQYCLRVASAVGLVCIEIFGHRNPRSRDYAVELGVALQLTNILRDVASDARRGRLYLPGEDLDRFQVPEQEVLQGRLSGRLRELMAFECQRARAHFFRAEALRPPEDRRSLFAAEIMSRIYFRILQRIEARDFDVWKQRVVVPRFRKGLIALGVWFKHKLPGGAG
jgi:phytoene synthase